MKSLVHLALGILAACSPALAEIRTFINRNGEAIKAELVSHSGGKVRIKREDGREFEVDPAIFSDEDHKRIRTWMATQPEAVRYNFNFGAKKKVMDSKGSPSSSYSKWSYEISITNMSQDTVSNLKIQYRVLYYSYSDKIIEGEEMLTEDLKFNRTMVITTTPVSIYKSRYSTAGRDGELKGCLVRILDGKGNVIKDWVSNEVGMKDKIWENTTPENGRPKPPPVIR